ncbi:MAG: TlpA family protein disulfide reductase [Methylosarcina sp.]
MKAQLGKKAPLLSVSEWVQGEPVNFDQLTGRVVLVEVFQVNCPGCFLYSLPLAIDLYHKYAGQGLMVLGVATAFEDFDKNTLDNLIRLVEKSEVVGETFNMLNRHGKLKEGLLPYQIPFPVAMDKLNKRQQAVTDAEIMDFIREQIPNFEHHPANYQRQIREQVQRYFQSLEYRAETFELYSLKGTPSHILVDKQGVLINATFGADPDLEGRIVNLLKY